MSLCHILQYSREKLKKSPFTDGKFEIDCKYFRHILYEAYELKHNKEYIDSSPVPVINLIKIDKR